MVIVADTAIWIDHLRSSDPQLSMLLSKDQILLHPFVYGEISMGSLPRDHRLFTTLSDLPKLHAIPEREVLNFVSRHRLYGLGIGYVDAHLITATYLRPDCMLWTRDKRLREVAQKLAIAYIETTITTN